MSIKTLYEAKVPGYLSKRLLIQNYVTLRTKTVAASCHKGTLYRKAPFPSANLPSGLWGEFTKILEVFFNNVAVRHMLESFLVRQTMLPNGSADFRGFVKYRPILNDYFEGTPIPEQISYLVEKVTILFTNVDRDMLSLWLWSYFWPYYLFREQISRNAVLEMKPVELGGGIG